MTGFTDETFLEIFMGSLSTANPLRSYEWRLGNIDFPSSKVLPIRTEWYGDVLSLNFDVGIKSEIDGVADALKKRGKKCERACQFGYGSQYAFYHYLNLNCERANFVFQYDDVFSSRYCLPWDFRIRFPTYAFTLEIKSVPPKMSNCRYYVNPYYSLPDHVVCVNCKDEDMLSYELYGWCLGSDVTRLKPTKLRGKTFFEIPVNRLYFKPYFDFHTEKLKLPYIERFDNEHYV